MVKVIKVIRNLLIVTVSFMMSMMVYGFYTVPDEIYSIPGENISVNDIYTITYSDENTQTAYSLRNAKAGKYNVDVSLFNTIPIKSSSLTVSERRYVVPSGEIFGLRLFTGGVVVVKTDSVDTSNGYISPAENAGLKKGDVIVKVNYQSVSSSNELAGIFANQQSNQFEIEFTRDDKLYKTTLYTSYSVSENKYKAGLWIRDSAAGIGTMTFYDSSNGVFAGLGHGVCDIDTGEILPFSQGDIVSAKINGCYKGQSGKAGELCGTFSSGSTGVLLSNNEMGVYGILDSVNQNSKAVAVAMKSEVRTGKAQIISSVDSNGPRYYDIEITKIYHSKNDTKNMVIKVTDKDLIEKTGGIVQGMSGSPIIQNGMLVGAVTHVFLNDPTQGYAIFAENMIETADGFK